MVHEVSADRLLVIVCDALTRYNVKVDIDNHLRYSDDEYKLHLTVRWPAVGQTVPARAHRLFLSAEHRGVFIFAPLIHSSKITFLDYGLMGAVLLKRAARG